MDINKALSVSNGLIVDEETGGPFYTGGTASPVGLDLPTSTIYTQTTASGVLIWRKYDTGVNDWRQLSAQDVPFDVTGLTTDSADLAGLTQLQETVAALADRNFGKLYCFDINASFSTTSTTYQPVVSCTETGAPAGTYRVSGAFTTTNSKANTNNDCRIVFDGTGIFLRAQSGGLVNSVSFFQGDLVFGGGDLVADIECRRTSGNGSATITNATLEMWRVNG